MNRIVFHHVRQVVGIIAGIDELQLGLRVLHGDAGHLPADAAEAVDADAHGLKGGASLAGALASHTCSSQSSHCTEAGHSTNTGSLRGAIASGAEVGPLHLRLAVLNLPGRRHEGTAQGTCCRKGTHASHGNVGGGGRHSSYETAKGFLNLLDGCCLSAEVQSGPTP